MSLNINLCKAKSVKNDEFYTQYKDIENELNHYKNHFKGKTIYCNCDNPEWSSFWKYFHINFKFLGIYKLIATYYNDKKSYKYEYLGGNDDYIQCAKTTKLENNGDFRSNECIDLIKESDIIITNPPFSLFREFINCLIEYKKEFLVIGNMNAIKYKEIFPLFMDNKIWLGITQPKEFITPQNATQKFGNIYWYTNLDHSKRHEQIPLICTYNNQYTKYDTFDAIEVSKVKDIPMDYDGIMGVPISFLTKYCSEQFKIIGEFNHGSDNDFDLAKPIIGGKELYPRIAIKKK